MPNRKKHKKEGAKIGGLFAAFTYAIDYSIERQKNIKQNLPVEKFNLVEFSITTATGIGLGKIGGILPDLLEPATSPHHRKFFHSTTAGTALAGTILANQGKMKRVTKSLVNALGASYSSHLALDAKTPKGLPFI